MTNDEKNALKQISVLVTEMLIKSEETEKISPAQFLPEPWQRYQNSKQLQDKEKTPLSGGDNVASKYNDGSFRKYTPTLLQYRFYYAGKRRSVYGCSPSECWLKRDNYVRTYELREQEKRRANGNRNLPSAQWTVKTWLEYWFKMYKEPKLKPSSLAGISMYMRKYLYPAIGKLLISEVTAFDLQELLTKIKSDCTRTKVAAVLSDSMRRACTCKVIESDPYLGVDFKRYTPPQLGALTHKQQTALLKYTQSDRTLNDVVRVLLMTGLRQGELLALTPRDVDYANKTITINKSWSRITHDATTPKTKAGNRQVPIESAVIEILKRYENNGRIFGDIYTNDNLQRKLSDALKQIGTEYSGHILRHTFITNAYELRISGYVVKCWVGHYKIEQALTYLALRKASEFEETEIVAYMRKLKANYTVI